jgi:hypothetical protein
MEYREWECKRSDGWAVSPNLQQNTHFSMERGMTIMNLVEVFFIYRVSQEECARLREVVPYGKVYRYNRKHLCPNLNGYGNNDQRKVWSCGGSMRYSYQLTKVISVCP